jgi:hypothetical protein
MFQLPAVPNLNVTPPQMPSPLDQYGKMLQLKTLLGQQAMQPLQQQEAQQDIQAKQLENQKAQMSLASQQALIKAVGSGFLTKYVGKETPDGSGFDANGAFNELVTPVEKGGFGVMPPEASGLVDSLLKRAQGQAEVVKTNAQAGEAQATIRTKGLETLHSRVAGAIEDPKTIPALLNDLVKNPQLFSGVPQDDLAHVFVAAKNGDMDGLKAAGGALDVDKTLADFHKSKAEAVTAQQKVIPDNGGMSPDTAQQVQKDVAVATNPQIQQGKEAVAVAEGRAREGIQVAMEPLRLQIQQQFQNQKDARDKIETSTLKPFQDKMTDIEMARTAISQALDNPVSARAAIFKMVGVAQPTGSHRVLPMEFTAFKYPGGITDQVKEKFNDFLKGEPWTPEIAQAASSFIDGQAGAAQRNLNSGIDNVNKLYGTSVGSGLKQQGAPKVLPLSAIQQAAKDHGISIEEATRQAQAQGYTVQ